MPFHHSIHTHGVVLSINKGAAPSLLREKKIKQQKNSQQLDCKTVCRNQHILLIFLRVLWATTITACLWASSPSSDSHFAHSVCGQDSCCSLRFCYDPGKIFWNGQTSVFTVGNIIYLPLDHLLIQVLSITCSFCLCDFSSALLEILSLPTLYSHSAVLKFILHSCHD